MAKTKTISQLDALKADLAAVKISDPKEFHPGFWRSLDDSRYYVQSALAFTKNADTRKLCISLLATLNVVFDGLYKIFLDSQRMDSGAVKMEVKHE